MKYIWTNHALERIKQRKLSQVLVEKTVTYPDSTHKRFDETEYRKRFGNQTIHTISKINEKGEHVIVSCWINPPNKGTRDEKKRRRYYAMQKGSFVTKFWLTLLNQFGL